MTDYYTIALFFPSHVRLGRVYELLEKLDDNDICVDYATLEFCDDGLSCEARYYGNIDIEEIIKNIGYGDMVLDWDTMSEWDVGGDEDEDE